MKKIRSVVFASVAVSLGAVAVACGDYSSPGGTGSAGSSGTGGSAGSAGSAGLGGTGGSAGSTGLGGTGGSSGSSESDGAVASCDDATPCGGDVVGTWTAMSSCLRVNGTVDMGGFGLGCASASVTGFLQVAGTWTLNSDGTYSDNTTTSGDEQLELPAECLNVSGTTTTCDRVSGSIKSVLGYASVACTDAASGGCTCSATVQQTGGMGLVSSSASVSGTYTTADNVVTNADGPQYSYCVSGNTMTVTPQSTTSKTGTVTGTVVFLSGSDVGGASCDDVTPCGGDAVGTWTATSSCLRVNGTLDMGGFGLGCASASVMGSLQVAGTWTLNSDGTYSDNTTTSGDEQLELPAECLSVSGTTTTCDRVSGSIQSVLGYASVTCTDAASGGTDGGTGGMDGGTGGTDGDGGLSGDGGEAPSGCTCSATVQQTGGMGLVSSSASASGTYTTADNVVTNADGPQYSYCVSGNTMTVTPQSTTSKTGTVTGTLVLRKQ